MALRVGEIQYILNEWVGAGGQWTCPEHLCFSLCIQRKNTYTTLNTLDKVNRNKYNCSYHHQLFRAQINYIFTYLTKITRESYVRVIHPLFHIS